LRKTHSLSGNVLYLRTHFRYFCRCFHTCSPTFSLESGAGICLAFFHYGIARDQENKRGLVLMKRKNQILSAVILSGSVGLGAQSIYAQGAPGGARTEPVPQPRPTQPTIPGQPAPGLPETDPMPGQPGTIPERVQRPDAGDRGMAAVTADDIKKAKEALKAKGLNPGPIDGILDGKTQQALRDFQKANRLAVTGDLDQQTAEKLGVALGNRGSIPEREQGGSMPRGGEVPKGRGGVQ